MPSDPLPLSPETESGKRLRELLRIADAGPLADTLAADWDDSIVLVEQEARTLARTQLRDEIEALPYSMVGVGTPPMVALDDAVDALKRFRDDVLSRLGERE